MADMLGSTLLNVGAETQRGGEVGFLDHGGNGYDLVGVSGQWAAVLYGITGAGSSTAA
jgi:hypothetical protein